MVCKHCLSKPVIYFPINNTQLCKSCFFRYLESKVKKTISKYKLIEPKDHIVVAISGGKDSLTTLSFINKIANKQRTIKITAVLIDEGISNYRSKTIVDAKKFCKKNKITLKVYSFKKEFGFTLDQMIIKLKMKPCTICGVLRRYLLNTKSQLLNANKLATGHNLEDESQSVIMNQFRNNVEISARMGPITGVIINKKFIRRIKPLYLCTEKEIGLFAFLNGFISGYHECPYAEQSYRQDVKDMLNNFDEKYPGTKYSIIQSFLEILPLLKNKYKSNIRLKYCISCGEPTSKEECQACQLIKKLK